jgi:hypothetical protein
VLKKALWVLAIAVAFAHAVVTEMEVADARDA